MGSRLDMETEEDATRLVGELLTGRRDVSLPAAIAGGADIASVVGAIRRVELVSRKYVGRTVPSEHRG